MLHLLSKIKVKLPLSINEKWVPKNVTVEKWYQVIAERTSIRNWNDEKGKKQKSEDLYVGIIDDIDSLAWIASFNLKVVLNEE